VSRHAAGVSYGFGSVIIAASRPRHFYAVNPSPRASPAKNEPQRPIWSPTLTERDKSHRHRSPAAMMHDSLPIPVAFSPDGRRIVSGSLDGTARIWDADTSEVVGILEDQSGPVMSVAVSLDGRQIVSGGVRRQLPLKMMVQ
jgi:WD40 repeat protein